MVGSTYSTCACAVVSHAPQTIMPIPSILMYAVILFSPPAECPRPPALRECSGGSGKVTCRQRGPVRHQACPSQAVRRDWARCLRQSARSACRCLRSPPAAPPGGSPDSTVSQAVRDRSFQQRRREGAKGCVINLFDGHACLVGQLLAGFELGRGLQALAVQLADLHGHAALRGLDRYKLALELAPLGGIAPDAERAGLAQQQLRELI